MSPVRLESHRRIDFTTNSVSPDGERGVSLLREVAEVQTPDADSAAIIGGNCDRNLQS